MIIFRQKQTKENNTVFTKTKAKLNNYKIAIIGLYLGRVAPGFLPPTTAFLNRNSGKKIKARNLFDNIARKTNKNTLFYKEHAKKNTNTLSSVPTYVE